MASLAGRFIAHSVGAAVSFTSGNVTIAPDQKADSCHYSGQITYILNRTVCSGYQNQDHRLVSNFKLA